MSTQLLRYQQFVDVYLRADESVGDRASRLYSAGRVRAAFSVDDEVDKGTVDKLLSLFAPTPAKRGRNALMIFDEWVVRRTYQQHVSGKGDLFYFSGSAISQIKVVRTGDPLNIEIYCEGGNLGGGMYTTAVEAERIYTYFWAPATRAS